MAGGQKGLGKGLSALFGESNIMNASSEVHSLAVNNIIPNKDQPRRTFLEKELEELAASIKSQGLLQPILVRPLDDGSSGKYEIVAGERRWRAAKQAGLIEVPVFVRTLSDEETLTAALIENIQREDLNPIEEAQAIQLLKESFGLSQEELASKLGKSRSAVANSLRLLALPSSTKESIISGTLSAGHARAILSVEGDSAQQQLQELIIAKQLSVRESEGMAATWKETGSFFQVKEQESASTEPIFIKNNNKRSKNKPQSAVILNIQTQICHVLQTEVKVTGKETKGKINITYNSKEELESLMEKFSTLQK